MAQWLESRALPMSLPAMRVRTPLEQDFQRNIMFLPSQSWVIVSMLCPWESLLPSNASLDSGTW